MRLIGLTGPSSFSTDCILMIEQFYESCPVLLYQSVWKNVKHLLENCEAVFLGGGVDIHPRTYRKDCVSGKNMREFDFRRDQLEVSVIKYCVDHQIPMFGICRGMQMLGVVEKHLTLLPDILADSTVIHRPSRQDPKFDIEKFNSIHSVKIIQGCNFPQETLYVNSFHHQGLLYDPKKHIYDSSIVGIANIDEKAMIIELMVCKDRGWMGCQWHPEWDYMEQESSRLVLQYFNDEFLTKLPDQ